MIEILDPGPLASIQDLGRPGFAALGVPRSGAFDRGALAAANRLVGNPDGAAGIESLLGGLRVRALHAMTVAITGAPTTVHALGASAAWGQAMSLPAGAELRLDRPVSGLRCYLAVCGGLDVEDVLGSASTDSLSGLGPPVLRAGDRLGVRPARAVPDGLYVRRPRQVLTVRRGPRTDWFTAPDDLLTTTWTVRADSDRVGVRLDGPPLERRIRGELPSEPTRPGAVQVPHDGRPIVFGPDAPTTGGYPVVAVVTDLDAAAQLRPGDCVRFRVG